MLTMLVLLAFAPEKASGLPMPTRPSGMRVLTTDFSFELSANSKSGNTNRVESNVAHHEDDSAHGHLGWRPRPPGLFQTSQFERSLPKFVIREKSTRNVVHFGFTRTENVLTLLKHVCLRNLWGEDDLRDVIVEYTIVTQSDFDGGYYVGNLVALPMIVVYSKSIDKLEARLLEQLLIFLEENDLKSRVGPPH